MTLRNHRADIVRIRKAIQHYTTTKYNNVQGLFRALDLDCDGVISMDDWVQGVKLLNFPISETDARKIFTAIDVDSDNGLSYSEIVSVLEPSTFTSFQNGVMSDETLGKLAGFQTFTSEQAKRLVETDADGHLMAKDSGSITPHSVNEEEEKRIIQAHKRRVLTRAQELHHLKSSVEWQLAQRDEPGTKRFLTLFRAADPENRGYLNHRQFRMLLGEKGLGLRINSRQENLLIEECSDGRGAIEARNFCSFLAKNFEERPDELEASKLRNMLLLDHRTADMDKPLPPELYRQRYPHRAEAAKAEAAARKRRGTVAPPIARAFGPNPLDPPTRDNPVTDGSPGPETTTPRVAGGGHGGSPSPSTSTSPDRTLRRTKSAGPAVSRTRPSTAPSPESGGRRSARSRWSARSEQRLALLPTESYSNLRTTWWANVTTNKSVPKNKVDSHLATRDGIPKFQLAEVEPELTEGMSARGDPSLVDSKPAVFAPYRRPQQQERHGWTGVNIVEDRAQVARVGDGGGIRGPASPPVDTTVMTNPFNATQTAFPNSPTPTPGPSQSPSTSPSPSVGSPIGWLSRRSQASTRRHGAHGPSGEVLELGVQPTGLAAMLASVQRTPACSLANQSYTNNPAFVPSPLLPDDTSLATPAPSKLGASSSSRRGASPAKARPKTASAALRRTYAGLPVAANRVLVDLKRTLTREPFKPETDFWATGQIIKPIANTAAYMSDADRFKRVAPERVSQEAQRAVANRRRARALRCHNAEKALLAFRDKEQKAFEEKETRRVVHRSRQKLRYMKSVLYGGELPPSQVDM